MVAVSKALGGADSLVLDNIVHYASPELQNVMRAKYYPNRMNYLPHAKELAHFAQTIKLGSRSIGREVVAAGIEPRRKDSRKCFSCGNVGHVKAACKSRSRNGGRRQEAPS